MITFEHTLVKTPFGPFELLAHGDRLVACKFADMPERLEQEHARMARVAGPYVTRAHRDPAGAATRLARYVAGDRDALDDQPVELHGTPFQCRVWNALREIRAGETWSYTQLAARSGVPRAVRAAGTANGANPLALFVPCHRVIAAAGTLGGYGGGLRRKQALLEHEGATLTLMI